MTVDIIFPVKLTGKKSCCFNGATGLFFTVQPCVGYVFDKILDDIEIFQLGPFVTFKSAQSMRIENTTSQPTSANY